MTDAKMIKLGGVDFNVPLLPIKINMKAYPLCRKLTAGDLLKRINDAGGSLDCTDEDLSDLVDVAFYGAVAADADLAKQGLKSPQDIITRAIFDDLPISPVELINAFFAIRYQTGGWVVSAASEGNPSGEAPGVEKPQT